MRRIAWIHQLDQLHAVYGSGADILPQLKAEGFTGISLKILDGVDWMGEFDTDQYRIVGWATLGLWEAACVANGLTLDAWVNVTPAWQSMIPYLADYCRQFAGRLVLDLEPYEGFFGENDPSEFLHQLQVALTGPTADSYYVPRVWISYDPRRADWIAQHLDQFGGQMPQVYGEYQITPGMVVQTAKPIEPLVSVGDSAADWRWILRDPRLGSSDGRTGFGVFKLPFWTADQPAVVLELA
jgi:hypothetical protein